ncbi:RING-H2 finger protein ATL56 [Cajanus cajan]|uniref:RING-H2 finger protein ATL1Q n=1 Tax=Cajanus cajan TaxID=3821 RepID=A0A151S9C6_CAJCA|nr:RING-H2 finger protein ATL56 [Cajanus cajan]KYP51410.1 RING-H2 finger protein ATL1Q [Cajanus cajan]
MSPPTQDHDAQSHSHPKPNPNLLSLFLKPIIMLLLTSLFFLFLGFAAFLLLHLFLLGGAFHRLRSRPSAAPNSSTAFPPREINKLPCFRLAKGSLPDSHCVVCLDAFRTGQCCRSLPACAHVFHRRCVDTWLLKVAACPTCRTPVRFNAGASLHDPIHNSCGIHTTNTLTAL